MFGLLLGSIHVPPAVECTSLCDAFMGYAGLSRQYLDLQSELPGEDSKSRFSVARYKPCANPHDPEDLPRFLPAGLTQYGLNNYTTKSPAYRVSEDGVSTSIERLEVEQTSGHHYVGGHRGVIVVLYQTHWRGILRPSWERETDSPDGFAR